MLKKGIDISTFQKNVNYNKLKSEGIEFAIIRCGYGKDKNQNDKMFETHYTGLKNAGIKVGTYLYSYCTSIENSYKEAENCLNIIKGKSFELPVFYDLEESRTSSLGKEAVTQIAINFCKKIEEAGYKAGIYANLHWFRNYINVKEVEKYSIWLAKWGDKYSCDFKVDFWQYTSSGQLLSIIGNVDLNYDMREELTENIVVKKSNEEIANDIISKPNYGGWGTGDERKRKLSEAGYDASVIQDIINNKLRFKKSNEEIANDIITKPNYGGWGTGQERKRKLTLAGYEASVIQDIINKIMS